MASAFGVRWTDLEVLETLLFENDEAAAVETHTTPCLRQIAMPRRAYLGLCAARYLAPQQKRNLPDRTRSCDSREQRLQAGVPVRDSAAVLRASKLESTGPGLVDLL